MAGLLPALAAPVLWVLYLSVTLAGQVFLGYQWDNLLLDAGFLAIWLAPWRLRSRLATDPAPPRVAIFLLHWLLFRLMLSSGAVKLASEDTAWSGLTALTYHYWTQPLPVWTAWYAHQSPLSFHKFSCGVMFSLELVLPFFIWRPTVYAVCRRGGLCRVDAANRGDGQLHVLQSAHHRAVRAVAG